jgi:hypothetical protein
MTLLTRRVALCKSSRLVIAASLLSVPSATFLTAGKVTAKDSTNVDEWMTRWLEDSKPRAPEGALIVSRFADPIYYLVSPVAWKPDVGQSAKYAAVTVPKGFVTDLVSVPRIFWSLLRPDGDYAYAAIIHDFLYWTQQYDRETADQIFQFAMQDFSVSPTAIATIYKAVRSFGGTSWNENAKLKAAGERRILKEFPADPRIRWETWKRRPGVFA